MQQVVGVWQVGRLLLVKRKRRWSSVGTWKENWICWSVGWKNSHMTTFFNSLKWQWFSPRSHWADVAYIHVCLPKKDVLKT